MVKIAKEYEIIKSMFNDNSKRYFSRVNKIAF